MKGFYQSSLYVSTSRQHLPHATHAVQTTSALRMTYCYACYRWVNLLFIDSFWLSPPTRDELHPSCVWPLASKLVDKKLEFFIATSVTLSNTHFSQSVRCNCRCTTHDLLLCVLSMGNLLFIDLFWLSLPTRDELHPSCVWPLASKLVD